MLGVHTSHRGDLCSTELNGDATLVASGYADGALRLCRGSRDALLASRFQVSSSAAPCMRTQHVVAGHSGAIYRCSISSDSKYVLSGGSDGDVRLWSASRAAGLAAYHNHGQPVWSVAFAPHDHQFLSCCADGVLRLFCTDRLAPARVMAGHLRDVCAAQFHPNGAYAISASQDTTLRLWDVNCADCVRLLQGHTAPVHDVAVAPDGATAASASDDGQVLLWHLATGRVLQSLRHDAPVARLAYDQTGRLLASATEREIYVWDARAVTQGPAPPVLRCACPARMSSVSFVAGLPVLIACAEDPRE